MPSTPIAAHVESRPRARSRFAVVMSWILFAIVCVGFSPTFYLRAFFPVPPIPLYLYAHGVVVTCWFVLFVVQASLVSGGRTGTHRRLGILGVVFAFLIGPPAVWFTLRFPARILALTGAPREALLPRVAEGVAAGLIAAVFSEVFLVAALLNYRRPQLHRRFMMLASVTMVTAAFTRIGNFPILEGINPHVVTIIGTVTLLGALWIHEFRARKTIHPVYVVGGSSLLLALLCEVAVLPKLPLFQKFVRSLL